MKEIKLSKGQVALVDDEDYEYLNQFKWNAKKHGTGYYARRTIWIKNKSYCLSMARVVMNAEKGQFVDHIDRNQLNNQKYNLRFCTHSENCRNRGSKGRSKYVGVSISHFKNKIIIRSSIKIGGKTKMLGCFKTEEDAAREHDKFAKIYYKEFANLNFKEC